MRVRRVDCGVRSCIDSVYSYSTTADSLRESMDGHCIACSPTASCPILKEHSIQLKSICVALCTAGPSPAFALLCLPILSASCFNVYVSLAGKSISPEADGNFLRFISPGFAAPRLPSSSASTIQSTACFAPGILYGAMIGKSCICLSHIMNRPSTLTSLHLSTKVLASPLRTSNPAMIPLTLTLWSASTFTVPRTGERRGSCLSQTPAQESAVFLTSLRLSSQLL